MDDLEPLKGWVGRTQTLRATADAWPVQALAAALDTETATSPGAPIPPLWHWMYFNPAVRPGELGPDGHPKRGGFLPPVPLPRRMWAGGRLTFARPLTVGAAIERSSTIADVQVKHGRSGRLVFVTVRHEIADPAGLCLTEEHDIVYREPPAPGTPEPAATPAPRDPGLTRRIEPDPVLLFRYSALTFNGHRIHYDQPYVTGVEGYPGLIVHGPLIATLLIEQIRRELPARPVAAYRFRAVRPLFAGAPFTVNAVAGDGSVRLWAADATGQLAMEASAELG